MKAVALLAAAALAFVPASGGTVSVAYAGSLVHVMEGPLAQALRTQTGLQFQGEAKGSKALANLIRAGLRHPDVFISADPALLKGLAPAIVFGSARMVVAYSDKSPNRALLEKAARGQRSVLDVLAQPGVRVGRTDPQLDPKGERTIETLRLLGVHYNEPAVAAKVLSGSEVFPEEDLVVRVESGEADAGFFYSTEIPGHDLHVVDLPAGTDLSEHILYAIAQMPGAPHAAAAAQFVDFVLHGGGRRILEDAGVNFLASPRRIPM